MRRRRRLAYPRNISVDVYCPGACVISGAFSPAPAAEPETLRDVTQVPAGTRG